jgi:hypothetical protein
MNLITRMLSLATRIVILVSWTSAALHAQSIPSALGWYQIPNTNLRRVALPDNWNNSGYGFNTQFEYIIRSWNSGVLDTRRNRLIIWGGGHQGYYGNEMYALNLSSLTVQRLNDPGLPVASSCVEAIVNGTQPNSRHTYDGISYMANVDRMFSHAGALACSAGNGTRETWTFNFATMTWQRMNPSGTIPRGDYGTVTEYDPNTGLVFVHDAINFYSYDFAANRYTQLSSGSEIDYHMTAVIDPKRKKFVILGGGQQWIIDISAGSSYTRQPLNSTGGSGIISSGYPGLAYDPLTDRIVAWDGGNTVYSLNLDTRTWTTSVYSGGPAADSNGTYGRWAYSSASGVFVSLNSVDSNAYTLRLTAGGSGGGDTTAPVVSLSTPTANSTVTGAVTVLASASDNIGVSGVQFTVDGSNQGAEVTSAPYSINWNSTTVSNGTHVLSARARDAAGNQTIATNVTVTVSNSGGSTGADFTSRCQAAGVIVCKGFDSTSEVKAGTWPGEGLYPAADGQLHGSLDTIIKASGGGSLRFEIPSGSGANSAGHWKQPWGQNFGEGKTFYVQFRQRFSPEMMSASFGGQGWKQVIFHNQQATCAEVELTTNNQFYRDFPQMYTQCGSGEGASLATQNGGQLLLEQGDYNCDYNNQNPTDCAYYKSNDWMTFYYEVKIGTWGQTNSSIKAWVGYEGQPLKQFINQTAFRLDQDGPGIEYNFLTLLPYDTGKDGRAHPTAYTWYDEVIVSTLPIASPGGSVSVPPDTTPPAPPINFSVN